MIRLCLPLALVLLPLAADAQTQRRVIPQPVSPRGEAEQSQTEGATPSQPQAGRAQPSSAPAPSATDAPAEPILRVSFDETEAIPGQPLLLRLTVLVPTFMPSPPVWPSFEAPNLLVRLPERSTSPVSERIEGQTWAGISRTYRISPMVPGRFSIPSQPVGVTFSDPESNAPVAATVETGPIEFAGVVPEGAEGLDPFIAARNLTLEQSVEGDPAAMSPGDSARRTVSATVEGLSPMFLPKLLPESAVPGVQAYPDEPSVEETEQRGVQSGSRTESVSLVAQGGGSGEAPGISLDWYNLDTDEIETASVDGFTVVVEGPPLRNQEPRDWRLIGLSALGALFALGFVGLLVRRLLPPLRAEASAAGDRWRESETYAFRQLRQVVSGKDLARLHPALDAWAARFEGPDPRHDPNVQAALVRLGAASYSETGGDAGAAWSALASALPKARETAHIHVHAQPLPPLNPGA
ncbi:hypothetical protein ACW9UR_07920 [Halovulum sp. GXIMD14794]